MKHPVLVFRDSRGAHLVSRPDGPRRILWPTWCVDSEGTNGPQPLGNWVRFVPSDWRPAPEPLPEPVRKTAEWVASIEDMDQVGFRGGRGGWMPQSDRSGPPEPE